MRRCFLFAAGVTLISSCGDPSTAPATATDTPGETATSGGTKETSTGSASTSVGSDNDPTSTQGSSGTSPSSTTSETSDSQSTGTDDGSSSGTETGEDPNGDGVPIFVALGQGARTMVSCDDGLTWAQETNVEDSNDDHGPYSSRGLAFGGGVFIAGVGWGNPGSLRVSRDGALWEETFPFIDRNGELIEPGGLIGVAFGSGSFVAVEGDTPWVSTDSGQTWSRGEDVPNIDNLRVVGFSGYDGGRFYAAGDAEQLFVSSDTGQTWQAPSSVSGGDCSGGNLTRSGGVVGNDDLFVVVTNSGNACRTDDGGESFSVHPVKPGETDSVVSGDVVWTGEQFYASSRGRGFYSDDAILWTEVEYNLPNASVRKVAVSPDTGTFVGVERDGETFYRSPDGSQWAVLGPDAATAGTDITQLAYGYAEPTTACPGR